jgi:two-component system chemotaxis sensor kinase CheA
MAEEFNAEGMLDMFLFESGQLLEKLEGIVLEHKDEESFDEASINEIFRIMHTIKGSSGIMMYNNITTISHKLEDVFYYLRESHPEHVPHEELTGYILDVSDFIQSELEKIQEGDEPDGDQTELVEQLDQFLKKIKGENGEAPDSKKSEPKKQEEKKEKTYVPAQQYYIPPVSTENSHFYRIKITYKSDTEMSNIRAYTAVYSLKEIAEDLLYMPDDIVTNEASGDRILKDGFLMLLQAQASKEDILKLIDTSSGVDNITIDECSAEDFLIGFEPSQAEPSETEQETAEDGGKEAKSEEAEKKDEPKPGDYVIKSKDPGKPKKIAKDQNQAAKQSFISVNVDKMDLLMDLIGELVIAEAVVLQNPDLKVPGLDLTNFQKAAAQLSKTTTELQDAIMSMRMMPLTNTFQKMNRIVFDASRKLGKDIDLEVVGENTEVDKNIIEHISDPLMHLIRNSVDHGIETREERKQTDKPPRGKITLEAKNEGGKVWIVVKDDGKGLNKQKIYKKACENGIADRKIEEYTDREIYSFITLPGFSTKEKVTELSGRGVGMDVVVKNIQSIGGSLDIDSEEGKGSTMTLKIPLTLAIIDGIILEVAGSIFVVETGAVKEFICVTQDMMVYEPNGEEYIMIRGTCYPVVRLNRQFRLKGGKEQVEEGIMVLLEHDEKLVCAFVDKLVGEQEIVVKPIPSYIKKVKGISGCTQLGDGSIALILDTGGLV